MQQILLIDTPAVLGWERWRAMEQRHALGLIKGALGAMAEEGGLAPELVDIVGHVVLATMNEIAIFVAGYEDPDGAVALGARAVDEILSRLLADR